MKITNKSIIYQLIDSLKLVKYYLKVYAHSILKHELLTAMIEIALFTSFVNV